MGALVPDPQFFVLLPHSDMHMVLSGPPLKMDVQMAFLKTPAKPTDPPDKHYTLGSVLNGKLDTSSEKFSIDVKFLAYHNAPPNRFADLPSVDPKTGLVTATSTGVFLFQVRIFRAIGAETPQPRWSVVGRLQVHQAMTDWWFGNNSITTAKHATIAHAQPTIYARYTEDAQAGTDVVGDITGHDYVQLASENPNTVKVADRGRLLGLAETATPVKISSNFLNKPGELEARVIDYAATRANELKLVRLASTTNMDQRANLVFVSEGFKDTPADRALFTGAVKECTKRMFRKPRLNPFSLLSARYNVFELFAPSRERGVTVGFQVTDNPGAFKTTGIPIPFTRLFDEISVRQTLEGLVRLVGLPKRGDTRDAAAIKQRWDAQRPGLGLTNVEDKLVEAWKAHRADGFLDAVDTRFGMRLGGRLADGKPEDTTLPPADPPATDDPASAQMKTFVNQLYTFFTPKPQIELLPDPRRHPPELYGFNDLTNAETSIVTYLAGQTFTHPFDLPGQSTPIGKEWVPDDSKATLSRGLVVIVAYENIRAGVALNNSTMVSVSASAKELRVFLKPPTPGRPERLTRQLPEPPSPPSTFDQDPGIFNITTFVDTVAHEIGHVYALADEYETVVAAVPFDATSLNDRTQDNSTDFGVLQSPNGAPNQPRPIDPKAKWLVLPRMRLASRLVADATPGSSRIQVQVSMNDIGKWIAVAKQDAQTHTQTPVSLRKRTDLGTRRQLPLSGTNPSEFQNNLVIQGIPNADTGVITLSFTTGLPTPPPVFFAGSALYLPQMRDQKPVFVVNDQVLSFMQTNHRALNHRPNDKIVSGQEPDPPDLLPGLRGVVPSNSYRTVGIYEGGNHASLGFYRPAGACKMRHPESDGAGGAYCFVCKWLLVNAVDPGQHVLLDSYYPGGQNG
jgi:hypothetical protein